MKPTRIVWTILGISLLTDFLLSAGGGVGAVLAQAQGGKVNWFAVGLAVSAAIGIMLRTLQTEFRAVGIKLSDVLRAAIIGDGGVLPPTTTTTPPEVKP
jgi:hypothetical protein